MSVPFVVDETDPVVATTLAAPAAFAPAVAVHVVEEVQLPPTDVPPTEKLVLPMTKLVPVIVIAPPLSGTLAGETPVTVGAL
ncbi:hypothetical protein D9M73_125630 [compost metagenome]